MSTLQIKWNLNELLTPLGHTGSSISVSRLSQDSREPQDDGLFVARAGATYSGVSFAKEAVLKGASAVLLQGSQAQAQALADELSVEVIAWDTSKLSLAELAHRFYHAPSQQMMMVGITGTNGKTSCAHFFVQLLTLLGKKTAMLGTLGCGFLNDLYPSSHTTLDAISLHRHLAMFRAEGAEITVMEVSSHAIDQGRVECVDFNLAAYTNLSRDHLDYHGSMSAYANTKARLFSEFNIPQQLLNADDVEVAKLLSQSTQAHRVSFSVKGHEAFAKVITHRFETSGIHMSVEIDQEVVDLFVPLMGSFNVSNILLVMTAAYQLGYPLQKIAEQTRYLNSVPGRMEVVASGHSPTIMVDYAHTPDALEKALSACREHSAGKVNVLFGCGGDRDQGKRPQMAAVAEALADEIWVTSDNPRTENPEAIIDHIMSGFKQPDLVHKMIGRADAIDHIIGLSQPSDVVLIAGKGHENYQEINGNRLPFSDSIQSLSALKKRGVA